MKLKVEVSISNSVIYSIKTCEGLRFFLLNVSSSHQSGFHRQPSESGVCTFQSSYIPWQQHDWERFSTLSHKLQYDILHFTTERIWLFICFHTLQYSDQDLRAMRSVVTLIIMYCIHLKWCYGINGVNGVITSSHRFCTMLWDAFLLLQASPTFLPSISGIMSCWSNALEYLIICKVEIKGIQQFAGPGLSFPGVLT